MAYAAPFWSPAQASAILFDWDGVIAETSLDFSPIREKYYGGRRAMLLEEAGTLPPDRREALMRDLEELEMEGAYRSHPVPGIEEVLAWVEERAIPWAVVSRNCRRSILAAAEATGVDLPAVVRSRDDGETVKPDPDALLETCAALGVPASQTLFIGDFIYDMIGARRTGMRGVLVRGKTEPDWTPWLECSYTSMHDLARELRNPSRMIPWEYQSVTSKHGTRYLEKTYRKTLEIPLDAGPDMATWVLSAASLGVGTFLLPNLTLTPELWKSSPAFDPSLMGQPLSCAVSRLLAARFPFAQASCAAEMERARETPHEARLLEEYLAELA